MYVTETNHNYNIKILILSSCHSLVKVMYWYKKLGKANLFIYDLNFFIKLIACL